MFDARMTVEAFDPELRRALDGERRRQEEHIELIASENYASPRVLEAQGSVLTNKYAEGYPGKRYYGGCEYVDIAEQLAIDRAKQLFGAAYANVQPHSGSQANAAVYFALMEPGETLLGMSLDHGGHLTHGHPLNFSGRYFKVIPYGVRQEDERIDYDEMLRLAQEHNPKVVVVGASAYPRTIDFEAVRRAEHAEVRARQQRRMPHPAQRRTTIRPFRLGLERADPFDAHHRTRAGAEIEPACRRERDEPIRDQQVGHEHERCASARPHAPAGAPRSRRQPFDRNHAEFRDPHDTRSRVRWTSRRRASQEVRRRARGRARFLQNGFRGKPSLPSAVLAGGGSWRLRIEGWELEAGVDQLAGFRKRVGVPIQCPPSAQPRTIGSCETRRIQFS